MSAYPRFLRLPSLWIAVAALAAPAVAVSQTGSPPAVAPVAAEIAPEPAPAATAVAPAVAPSDRPAFDPLVTLGIGDAASVVVFGKPELSVRGVVDDAGALTLPLIGAITVVGLSPSEAAARIAEAYRAGEFLVQPQVTVTLEKVTSQMVTLLGEVAAPGRYPVESRTSVFDLLAAAGGKTKTGGEVLVLVRTGADGTIERTPIDLSSLADPSKPFPKIRFEGGDTIYVPRAPQVFIHGEVAAPGQYALQPGTTLIQALTIAGGVTRRGSLSRIEIKRKTADGTMITVDPDLEDRIEPDDVIRVKESIF